MAHIRKAWMILVVILAVFATIAAKKGVEKKYRALPGQTVRIRLRLDVYQPDFGKMSTIRDSLLVFNENDIHGWSYWIQHDLAKQISGSDKFVITEMPPTRFFFFYKEGEAKGILYDSMNIQKIRTLSVDSFIHAKFQTNPSMFYNDKLSFEDSVKDIDGCWMERYTTILKTDDSIPDSVYLYFDPAMNDLRYSFQPGLDSSKKAKMCRGRFIFNPSGKIPRREYDFHFERADPLLQEDMQLIKERFVRESGNQ